MTSKLVRKQKKKSERNKRVQKKLELIREKKHAEEREELQEMREYKKFKKAMRAQAFLEQEMEKKLESMTADQRKKCMGNMEQLRKNAEILRGLEQEFLKELEARQDLNKQLEEMGYVTAEEKMRYLQEEAMKIAKQNEAAQVTTNSKSIGSLGGGAICSFKANEPIPTSE